MPTAVEKALLRIKLLEGELGGAREQLRKAQGRQYITCKGIGRTKGCGARLQIRKLTYIQTYWYEPPYGCTGGDFWHPGEGQFDCPKCGLRNRLIDERERYSEMMRSFENVVHEKKDRLY